MILNFYELEIKKRLGYRKADKQEQNCENCANGRETTRITTCDLMQYEVDKKDICDLFTGGEKNE